MSSSAKYIPEELEIEILSRLPLKSLMRFKCVCKSWLTLICNTILIHKRLSNGENTSSSSSNYLLVSSRTNKDDKVHYFHAVFAHNFQVIHTQFLPRTHIDHPHGTRIHGTGQPNVSVVNCCNGVICLMYFLPYSEEDTLSSYRFTWVLWNPSSGEAKLVPTLGRSRFFSYALHCGFKVEDCGFGFNSRTNDYELVVIYTLYNMFSNWLEAKVYSLRRNCWNNKSIIKESTVDSPLPDSVGGYGFSGYFNSRTCVNEVLSWTGYKYTKFHINTRVVLSFDLNEQEFKVTPFPLQIKYEFYDAESELEAATIEPLNDKFIATIEPLNDSLGLFTFYGSGFGRFRCLKSSIDVWVLGEYGVEESWIHLYAIDFSSINANIKCSKYWPLRFGMKSISEIFFVTNEGELLLYDHVTQKFNTCGIYGIQKEFQVFYYKPNSVSFGGIKCLSRQQWVEMLELKGLTVPSTTASATMEPWSFTLQ